MAYPFDNEDSDALTEEELRQIVGSTTDNEDTNLFNFDLSTLGPAQKYFVDPDVSQNRYNTELMNYEVQSEPSLLTSPNKFGAGLGGVPDYRSWAQNQYQTAANEAVVKNLSNQLLQNWQGLGENVGIGSAGTDKAEIGGRPLYLVASDFAQRLAKQGITDLSQAKFTPGQQASWTEAGKGNVSLVAAPDGRLIPVWGSSSDATKARQVALAIGSSLIAPGLAGALGGGVAGSAGAGAILGAGQAAITGGDILKGALLGGVGGGITAGVNPFAQSVGADVLASTGSQALSDFASGAVTAGARAVPTAITTGNFGNVLTSALTGGVSAGASQFASELTGLPTKDINAAIRIAQGVENKDWSAVLAGANNFINSPDVALASQAARVISAVEKGNPSAIVGALQGFGQEMNRYNQYYSTTDTGDETARLQARYGTSRDIQRAATQTQTGADLGGVNLAEPTITPEELAQIVSGAAATDTVTAKPAASANIAERLASQYLDKLGVRDQVSEEQVAAFQIAYRNASEKIGDRSLSEMSIQDILNNAPNIVGKDESGRWLDDQGYSYDAQGMRYRADGVPVIEIVGGFGEDQKQPVEPVDLSNVQISANALQEWANGLQGTEGEVIRQALSTGAGLFGEQIADLGFALSNMGFADRTNFLVRFGTILEKTGQNLEIPQVTQATQNFWKALEAPGSYAEKAAEGFKALIDNPLVLVQVVKEVGQEGLPLLVGGGLGKLLGWAGQGIARAGTLAGDVMLNSAESMGSTARSKFQEEIEKGTPEAEAARLANTDGWKAFAITATLAGVSDAGLAKKIEGGLDKLFGKVATATGKEWGEEGLEELAIALATGDSLETAIAKSLAGSFIGSKTSGSLQAQAEFNQKVADVTQQVAEVLRSEGITSTDGTFRPSTFTDVASQASVGTDSETGQDVTLADLTGAASISTAPNVTQTGFELGLGDTDLDANQIISDYINEVLGGNAPATSLTENIVLGTDPDTGAEVTIGDLGLTTKITAKPDLNLSTPVATDPNTGEVITLGDVTAAPTPDTKPKPDTAPDTIPKTDVKPDIKPDTTPKLNTAPDIKSQPDVKPDVKPEADTVPKTDVTPDVKLTPDVKTTPDVQPDVEPDIDTQPDTQPKPETAPETKPDVRTDVKPDVKPDITKDSSPDATPVITPDVKPKVTPDTTPAPNVRPRVDVVPPAPSPLPPGVDEPPPITEEDLRQIVSGPPPSPTPAPPPPPSARATAAKATTTVKPSATPPAPSPAPRPVIQTQGAELRYDPFFFKGPEFDPETLFLLAKENNLSFEELLEILRG